jgi:hypothetical protein
VARQAQQAKGETAKSKGGLSGRTIGTAVLMLPVIGVLLPTCLVLVVSMAPTVVALVVDRSRDKYLAITVGLLNFCGTFPAIAELWGRGQSLDAGLDVATDPLYWLFAYGAAAIGWGIYLLLPPMLAGYYATTSARRLQSLRARQAALVQSWGEEVAGARAEDDA